MMDESMIASIAAEAVAQFKTHEPLYGYAAAYGTLLEGGNPYDNAVQMAAFCLPDVMGYVNGTKDVLASEEVRSAVFRAIVGAVRDMFPDLCEEVE